ncbi:MAG: response regulator [Bdellovibrionota bacterium]
MNAPLRILCVDDEPDIRRVLSMALRFTLKAEVATAASAKEAFAHLAANPAPDAVLLDCMMPEIDGYSACQTLRADARYRDLPVIFLSAKANRAEQEQGLRAGADACLTKPFDPMKVGQEVSAVIQEIKARRNSPAGILEK